MAALGKPRDLSPVSPTASHLASSLPDQLRSRPRRRRRRRRRRPLLDLPGVAVGRHVVTATCGSLTLAGTIDVVSALAIASSSFQIGSVFLFFLLLIGAPARSRERRRIRGAGIVAPAPTSAPASYPSRRGAREGATAEAVAPLPREASSKGHRHGGSTTGPWSQGCMVIPAGPGGGVENCSEGGP